MAAAWYCNIDGTEYGPLTGADLKRMAEQGKLRITDQIKNTPTGKWVAASSVKGLVFKKVPEPGPALMEAPNPVSTEKTCPSCRANLKPAAVLCIRCGFDTRTGKKLTAAKPSPSGRNMLVGTGIAAAALIGISVTFILVFRDSLLPNLGWAGTKESVPQAQPGKTSSGTDVDSKSPALANRDEDAKAVATLLATVVDSVSDESVRLYEKMRATRDFIDVLVFEGTLPTLEQPTGEIRKRGAEKLAATALIKLIQEKQNSSSKKDLIICGQALRALSQLGVAAAEALPMVKGLKTHGELVVASKAALAVDDIENEIEGAQLQAKDPETFKDRQGLQGAWKPVRFEATGLGGKEPDKNAMFFFRGGKVSISVPGMQGTLPYRLDVGKRPKEIDLLDGKIKNNLFGLYQLDTDTLTLCVGKQRPKRLSIQDEEFAILVVLKRSK